MILTDEEMKATVKHISHNNLSVFSIGRAIETAVLQKLLEQSDPIAYIRPNQLVPTDPEGQWSNNDLINIMVDAYQNNNDDPYDRMLAAYKAMLAAAKESEK